MKVRELQEQLALADPDDEVVVINDNYRARHESPIRTVRANYRGCLITV
jgi:hypothetical protein